MKPSPYAKPGAIAGARPTGVRPGLTRQPTAEERRRAQRVLLRMPVLVHIANKPEAIQGFTHTVSATGAMIILREGIPQGTKFILENPKTQQKIKIPAKTVVKSRVAMVAKDAILGVKK